MPVLTTQQIKARVGQSRRCRTVFLAMVSLLMLPLTPLAAAVPEATLPAAASPLRQIVALQARRIGTYYVNGAIQGLGSLDFLVDTGSSYMVIGEDLLAPLKANGLAEFSRELRGSMADGSVRIVPLYRLAGLRIGEGCWINNIETAIFPSGSRPILGMGVLSQLAPFTFSTNPPHLELSQCEAQAQDGSFAALDALEAQQQTQATTQR